MKKISTILVLIFVITSCNRSKDLEGTWIEIDNFNNPAILKYWEGKFYQYDWIYQDTVNYKATKNSIIYLNRGKATYQLTNDTLSFSFDSVTYPFKLEKLTFNSYTEYLFNKLNISIDLPEDNAYKIAYSSNNNFITLSKSNDSIYFSFNGHFYDLKSFTLEYDDFNWFRKRNLLFIDSSINMGEVNKLENVLSELYLPKVAYVTKSFNNNGMIDLRGYKLFLPSDSDNYTRLTYSDNIRPIKTPPRENILEIVEKDRLILEFTKSKSLLNNLQIDFNNLSSVLKNSILNNEKLIIYYHISDDCTYARFIDIFKALNKPYKELRESLATEKYGDSYYNLDSDQQKMLRKTYPRRISKISYEELKLLKNNS